MFRVSFSGQSYVDGVEFPLRIVYDVDSEKDLREKVNSVFLNFLEEMDDQVPGQHMIATLTMEVIQLCPVR